MYTRKADNKFQLFKKGCLKQKLVCLTVQ